MEAATILGLSINTRMLGLAVIKGTSLEDYHIYLRKEPWTPRKRELILTSLRPWCTSYSITSIALSTPYETHQSLQIKDLLASLDDFFEEHQIPLYRYPTKKVYSHFEKAKTKKELMQRLCMLYPELTFYCKKELQNRKRYYIKLFEAVGVATLHAEKLKRNQKR